MDARALERLSLRPAHAFAWSALQTDERPNSRDSHVFVRCRERTRLSAGPV